MDGKGFAGTMGIRVARGVATRIREDHANLTIQVQQAAPLEAAVSGLERARADIWNLDGGWRSVPNLTPRDRNNPSYVSEVLPARTGPFIFIDGAYTPQRLLRTIPDIVADRLAEAGVWDAVIAAPRRGDTPLFELSSTRTVVLRMFPPPPASLPQRSELPARWLEEACAWVRGPLGEDDDVAIDVDGMQFSLRAAEAMGFLEQCRSARSGHAVLAVGPEERIRAANACFHGAEPNLAMAAGGAATSEQELVEVFQRLRGVARRLASEVAYAFISIEPNFIFFVSSAHETEWYRAHGGGYPGTLEHICDEWVFDAFPYQILGPGHLSQLGGPLPAARPLAAGRVEVSIQEPADWLIDPWLPDGPRDRGDWTPWKDLSSRRRDDRVQDRAREILAPCLPDQDAASRAVRAKWDANTRPQEPESE